MTGVNDPLPPAPPGEALPVPPRPVATAPTTQQNEIIPAGGVPYTAGPDATFGAQDRRRKGEPNPANLPSPFAPMNPPQNPNPAPNAPDQNLVQVKRVLQIAATRWAVMDTYETRMVRREVMGGKQGPTEEIFFQFRQKPFSVYMRNIGEAGNGREVLYVQGAYKDEMQILTGAGDGIRGLRVTRSPDDPSVKSRSRHSIREAGFGNSIAKVTRVVEQMEAGRLPADTVKYGGVVKRQEFGDRPLELLHRTVAARDEALDQGGTWAMHYDARPESPSFGFPILAILTDARGAEIEYIRYDQFRGPANLTDADFIPDRLGKKK